MPSGSDGADRRPPHVKLVKGRWYWDPPDRLRRAHGLRTIALGADQAAAWAYARTLNRDHLQLGPGAPRPGSVEYLLQAFLNSSKFAKLAASTQRDYRWLAERVLPGIDIGPRSLGAFPATAIRPRHADLIYEKLEAKHGHSTAHYACRFARRVWKWGYRRELTDSVNPWADMELRSLPQRRQRWTVDQVASVVGAAEAGGRQSLALATLIAYWLGHREGDVLSLTWTALRGGVVETSKTGEVLPVDPSAYPALQAAIEAERVRQTQSGTPSTHVIVNERTGRPYLQHTFVHDWRTIARKAGIPDDLQFRDLRATALTELADAGADVIPMSTHSGHKTVQMTRRYARRTVEQFREAARKRISFREK